MEEQIAAQIYLSGNYNNIKLLILNIIKQTENHDIEKIIEIYSKILDRKIIVAHIKTSIGLKNELKEKITNFVQNQYKTSKIIFYFEIDSQTRNGIEIKVGDDILNFNF
jgi:F0F1-type ATP synthase delta subunit